MAIYVTSDAHGHVRALDEALSAASPGDGDTIFVLGDMVDRGPDPLGVINVVRGLEHAHALMGNHEQLMLAALSHVGNPARGAFDLMGLDDAAALDWVNWMNNGGGATLAQLEQLGEDDYDDVLAWVRDLPLSAVVRAAGRTFALVHAGIDGRAAQRWLERSGEGDEKADEAPGRGQGTGGTREAETGSGAKGARQADSPGEAGDAGADEVAGEADGASEAANGAAAGNGASEAAPQAGTGETARVADGASEAAPTAVAPEEAEMPHEAADAPANSGTSESAPASGGDVPVAGTAAPAPLDPSVPEVLAGLLEAQDPDVLLWIRDAFWGYPTGLVRPDGTGPVVIAGHTPSPYLRAYVPDPDLACVSDEGLGTIVRVGSGVDGHGPVDRIDIDCAAAAGFGLGRVGVLRLDDLATWFAPVREGE